MSRFPVYGNPPALPGYAGGISGDDTPLEDAVTGAGLAAALAAYAKLAEEVENVSATGALTLLSSDAKKTVQRVAFEVAATTIRLPTPAQGSSLTVMVVNRVAGDSVITAWDAVGGTVRWPDSLAPALTLGASAIDVYTFFAHGTVWYGMKSGANFG